MHQEKYTLRWYSYLDRFQNIMKELIMNGYFADLVNPDVPEPGIGCLGHDGGHGEDDGELAGAGVRGHTAHQRIMIWMNECE